MTQEMTPQESTPGADAAAIIITGVRFEHRRDLLGIGTGTPRLSWIVAPERAGWRQTAYEITMQGPDGTGRGQTGRIESDQSVLVPWPFAPLESRERAAVRVRV